MASNLKLVKSHPKKVAIYIGRFQPFHLGHVHIAESAIRENDLTIILVGSANQAPTTKNPFSFAQRKAMITNWAGDREVAILPVEDVGANNTEWILSVQAKVAETITGWFGDHEYDITLYGADKDKSSWYVHAFPQWKKKLVAVIPEGRELSATVLRSYLFGLSKLGVATALHPEVPPTTLEFVGHYIETPEYAERREEYAFIEAYKAKWAGAPYEPSFITVDGVVIQSGHVLVVRRANQPGKGLIALPGGFVKNFQTLIEALVAEITEETGLRLAEGKRALEITKDMLRQRIRANQYFDDPNRSLRGRTLTHAFLIRLDDTKPLPWVTGMDAPLEDTGGVAGIKETLEAFWMPIHEALASPAIWFEDHYIILRTMYSMIKE